MPKKNESPAFLGEIKPYIKIEHIFTRKDKPGVEFFRVSYGSDIVFIGSDGSVELAEGPASGEYKKEILKSFQELRDSEDGKEDEAELRLREK